MARIRSVKPDVWEDEKFGFLTMTERVVWFNRLTQADDAGRFVASPVAVAASVSPFQPPDPTEVEKALDGLHRAGLIHLYTVGACQYGHFPKWGKHQKIDKPQPPKYPDPNDLRSSPNHSSNDSSNDSTNDSSNDSSVVRRGIGEDRIGEEGKGEEEKVPSEPMSAGADVPEDESQDEMFLGHSVWNGKGKPHLSPHGLAALWNEVAAAKSLPLVTKMGGSRLRAAKGALKDESNWEVWGRAFELISRDEFLTGRNDTSTVYADFDYAIRPAKREKWLDRARGEEVP